MKLYLSHITNTSKPDTFTTKKISATILENLVTINLKDFAEQLTTKGKTVVLAELSSPTLAKQTPIIGQELVMLDFDNQDSNNQFTINDLEQDQFLRNHACFFYKTFSDAGSNVDKFRVVLALDTMVTDNATIESIYQELFKCYPQADSSVGQTSRLFFGSNQGYQEIDWDNQLSVNDLLTDTTNVMELPVTLEIIDDNTPNYLLLKHKKYDLLKEKLGHNYSREFPDEVNAYNYFCELDIKEFLELPDENPFIDILHNEDNPSASVYYAEEHGIYLYKCFSQRQPFTGNICLLLSKYLGLHSKLEAVNILLTVTSSSINNQSELGQLKLQSNLFRKDLTTGRLKNSNPELYDYLKRYIPEINATLDSMYDYAYTDSETKEIRYLSYFSVEHLAKNVGGIIGKKVSTAKMWTVLSLIVVIEMVEKLPVDSIPKNLYTSLIEPQEKDNEKIRTSNIYEPVLFNDINIERMSSIAKKLKENNVIVTSLSYELIYRLFGKDKALKDFPQAYSPLVDKGVIKMSRKDNNLTNKSIQLEKTALRLIRNELDSKGYVFESKLISSLARNKNCKIATIKPKYAKIRSDIINKYGLERKRMTKELHKQLRVRENYSSCIIIYKE